MLYLDRKHGRLTAHAWIGCAILAFICLLAQSSLAAVTATPNTVVFRSPEQTVTITLTQDGAPVPAADMGPCKLFVSGHDYDEMFVFEKRDGAVTLVPTKYLEVGRYDLVIRTKAGEVHVAVYTPLSDQKSIVEKRAEDLGVSVEEAKLQLGLAVQGVRTITEIELPPVYYEGQTLELAMPETQDSVHVWRINGEVVRKGADAAAFSYTFREPGEYTLAYTEMRGDAVVTAAAAHTTVVALPPIPVEVGEDVDIAFRGIAGYGEYTWKVDGRPLTGGVALKHAFIEPGAHTVECLSAAPNQGPEDGFVRQRYAVTVK
ncbi:MAG: hypothetical protein GY851_32350 [bacterium]|nr:hypothetical protein [bacterium]